MYSNSNRRRFSETHSDSEKAPMKMIKTILTAIAIMMMAICSTRAYTIESVTTNYSSFTAAITVFTNKPVIQASNLFKYTVGKAKISNKQLLTLFSSWVFTNAPGTNSWPLGARLIFDWDSYQVCVADVSGTNILMHCLDDLRAYALGTNY